MPVNVFTMIDDPAGPDGTFANGINDAGQIVGQFRDASNFAHGFLLSGGVFTALDDPSAARAGGTFANGINGSGQVVGSFQGTDFRVHGFLLSGGIFSTIDGPSAPVITDAAGINNQGQIVGTYNDGSREHGFLRSSTGSFIT